MSVELELQMSRMGGNWIWKHCTGFESVTQYYLTYTKSYHYLSPVQVCAIALCLCAIFFWGANTGLDSLLLYYQKKLKIIRISHRSKLFISYIKYISCIFFNEFFFWVVNIMVREKANIFTFISFVNRLLSLNFLFICF